jgi:hypothetical protein
MTNLYGVLINKEEWVANHDIRNNNEMYIKMSINYIVEKIILVKWGSFMIDLGASINITIYESFTILQSRYKYNFVALYISNK